MINIIFRRVITSEQGDIQSKSSARLSGETTSLKKESDSLAVSNK